MGFGAIAGLVGGLASAGAGIAGALGGSSPQSQAGALQGQWKGLANMFLGPYMQEGYWAQDIPGMASQSIRFGLKNAPKINAANMQQLQSLLGQALPGYQGMVGQAATNTASLLAGNVPSDVQQQIQRNAAFSTLQSGAFAGGAPTGAVTARDLGLTSLQLQGQGQNQLTSLIGTARNYLMPGLTNPMSLLPLQDLISGSEWSKVQQYNATQNYVNMRAQGYAAQYGAPYQSNMGALGSGINTGLGALGGLINQFIPGGGGGGFGGSSGSSMLGAEDWLTGGGGSPDLSGLIGYLGGI